MKKKIQAIATLTLTGALIFGFSYLLPLITEVKLKNEEDVKAARIVETNEETKPKQVDIMEMDDARPYALNYSDQFEWFVLTAKKAFKDEVGIELTDNYASFGSQATNGENLTINWEFMDSDLSDVYYGAIFSNFSLDKGTGNLVEVSVMGEEGSPIEKNFLSLNEQATKAFKEYLGIAPSNPSFSPHVEVRNETKRVYLTWEEYDDSNDIMNFFEAWFEMVNKDNTEGKLVHLNHEIIPRIRTVAKKMDADDAARLDAAKEYVSNLGYHTKDLIGQYMRQDGSLMIYSFTIEHDRFDQLSIMLNEDGDWSGSTIGTDIKNYYCHDTYEEIKSKYSDGSSYGEDMKNYYNHDIYEEIPSK